MAVPQSEWANAKNARANYNLKQNIKKCKKKLFVTLNNLNSNYLF